MRSTQFVDGNDGLIAQVLGTGYRDGVQGACQTSAVRRADMSTESLWIELSSAELLALNPSSALGPFDPGFAARRLGFGTGRALDEEASRLTGNVHAQRPMPYRDWAKAIEIVSALMSPLDSEWQTVIGLNYLETAEALSSITRKVDLAFGGTRNNPAIGPDRQREE